MTKQANEHFIRNVFFEKAKPRFNHLINRFVKDAPPVLEKASSTFERMLSDMIYVDKPKHPLASPFFQACAELAVYLALKTHNVSVHDFGCAMLTNLAKSSIQPINLAADPEGRAKLMTSGKDSQKNVTLNEVVFDVFTSNDETCDWGIIFYTCATCTLFSKYGARDLVPYICAKADILSDKGKLGLKRSGTIALGSQRCEYRYKSGGKPQHLSAQYPDHIRYMEGG